MDSTPLVSVVTPFYNTEAFLAECIESVLTQTHENWEYVLVDNCSTDGSVAIAERYASRCPKKIRLVRTSEFLPQLANYNFALSQVSASSKYCKMVQADDWIYPACLERMVDVAEKDASVGIVSSYRLLGDRLAGDRLDYNQTIISGREICRLQLSDSRCFYFGSPTAVLYRSEIVRSTARFFDESALHADTNACYRTLQTWNFGFVHDVLSFSRVGNENSVTMAVRSFGWRELGVMVHMYKFGQVYLAPEEFASRLRVLQKQYYRFLARKLLSGESSKPFWDYHVAGLRSVGQELDKGLLARYCCGEVVRLVANPGSTVEILFDRLRKNGAGEGAATAGAISLLGACLLQCLILTKDVM